MRRPPAFEIAVLATATMLGCGSAHAQARGPSAREVLEGGQFVGSNYRPTIRSVGGWREIPIGEPVPDVELAALGPAGVLDEATRTARIAELETWLRRLPGRFRIDGRVEKPGAVTVDAGPRTETIYATLQGKVSGIADCDSVGEGVAVHCILNATWPIIEFDVMSVAPGFGSQASDGAPRPPDSESLKTLQPGMIDIGLNLDPPGIRAMLVTDDSIAHTWAGRLTDSTLKADRLTDCQTPTYSSDPSKNDPQDHRCLQPFEMIAGPDSETVTIILRKFVPTSPLSEYRAAGAPLGLTISLIMYRDAEAQPEQPMKTKKAR